MNFTAPNYWSFYRTEIEISYLSLFFLLFCYARNSPLHFLYIGSSSQSIGSSPFARHEMSVSHGHNLPVQNIIVSDGHEIPSVTNKN